MSSVAPAAADPTAPRLQRRGEALRQVAEMARSAAPPLLFGLRMWGAVCLTCYVAFWLELDSPNWAATTAAIVCQPSLGASLRKGSFRMIGTIIGAIAIVVLTACFPQERVGFLLALALWSALCGMVATVLQNFASYAAALAGYTAVIVAMDELGTSGGLSGDVLTLAINRAGEICVGIVCAGMVLAGTDFGGARRDLAAKLAGLAATLTRGVTGTFLMAKETLVETQTVRRKLIREVTALGPIIDQAIGESSELRYRSRALQRGVDGMFTLLASWRIIAEHLRHLPDDGSRREADAVLPELPEPLRAAPQSAEAADWTGDPIALGKSCRAGARALVALPAKSPSLRLLADQTAKALLGLTRVLDGLALLHDPRRRVARHRLARIRVPDWLPSLVNAARIFATLAAAELLWIVTAWPQGAMAMTFAAITVILMSLRDDQAYGAAVSFLTGAILVTVLAAIILFAVLPRETTFLGFALALGSMLVPIGALSAQPWKTPVFGAMAMLFTPILGPQNQMSYDAAPFFNAAAAIIVGVGLTTVSLRLIPPLSPELRARRLLALTLRDLRRLALGRLSVTPSDWESRVFGRLSALPPQAELLQGAQLVAALSVGTEIIRLRRVADRLGVSRQLDGALDALAQGDGAVATERLAEVDHRLAAIPDSEDVSRLRARAGIRAMSEALALHGAYFSAEARR